MKMLKDVKVAHLDFVIFISEILQQIFEFLVKKRQGLLLEIVLNIYLLIELLIQLSNLRLEKLVGGLLLLQYLIDLFLDLFENHFLGLILLI